MATFNLRAQTNDRPRSVVRIKVICEIDVLSNHDDIE